MPEMAAHLAIEGRETTKERRRLSTEIVVPIHIRYDFDLALKDLLMTKKVTKWILRLGHLYQYRLAIHIDRESKELQKTEMKTTKKSQKHNITTI